MTSEVWVHGRLTRWLPLPSYPSAAAAGADLPIWRVPMGWILLAPMLYLANGGRFSASVAAATQGGDGTPLHKIVLVFVALIFLAVISNSKAPLLRNLLRSKLVLALPIFAICSSVWSEQPLQSLTSGVLLLVFTVFTICIAADFDFQRQVELIIMVGAVALPASIAVSILAPSIGGGANGWAGIFSHKQNCAAVCTLWLITALHWWPRGFHLQFFKSLYIVMCAALIVMSRSRTGWLLACVALLLWFILAAAQRVRSLEIVLGFAVSVPISLLTAYAIFSHFGDFAIFLGKDATLSQRTIIWDAVWVSILKRPYFGYGFSGFWSGLNGPSQRVVLISDWSIQQAQNGYLDLWLGLGIGGVAIIALMGAFALRASFKSVPLGESGAQRRWSIVVIVATMLYCIGESAFGLILMVWFLFLLAYLGLQSVGRDRNAQEHIPA